MNASLKTLLERTPLFWHSNVESANTWVIARFGRHGVTFISVEAT